MEVEKGSPADGVLEVGDVILGADGTGAAKVPLFEGHSSWAEMMFGDPIAEAEARNPAVLNLLVWRKGQTSTIPIKLHHLGRYSETAPYNCPKSKAILRAGIKTLYEQNKPDKIGWSVLCMIAANDPTDPDNAKYQARAKEWVYQLEPAGGPWQSGPQLMALAEYYMQTKDEGILPRLREQAERHARGVSWVGTTGHRWCDVAPDGSYNGRIGGYGPITCSGGLGFLGLSLARQAGVTSPQIEKSHQAQRAFFGHYAFRAGMGYGEHPYGITGGRGDYNGKQSTSGLAMSMEPDGVEKAKYFARMAALSGGEIRKYAHGGTFFGQVFHPLGANLAGEKAANLEFREVRWHMDLKRLWDFRYVNDTTGGNYNDYESRAVALLFYATPLKQTYLTGKGHNPAIKLTDAEFQELVETKNYDPTKVSNDQLIADMARFQGMLRGENARELAARVKANPTAPEFPALIDRLLAIAADPQGHVHARTGACAALAEITDRFPDPLKSLKSAEIAKVGSALLADKDSYIRFAGVRAMERLDVAVLRPHLNQLMDAIAATGRPLLPLDPEDPLQWAHGAMGQLLAKVIGNDLNGVDRSKLIPALRSAMQTPNGEARSHASAILGKLSKEEVLQVADVLVDNIKVPSPANSMFSGAAGRSSQSALANHLFEEALPLGATYNPMDAIASKIPQTYGKSALAMRSSWDLMQVIGEQLLVNNNDVVSMIDAIQKGEAPKELNKLMRIDGIKTDVKAIKLPDNKMQLVVEAVNYGVGDKGTTYTWRKICGAGNVSFEPNGSHDSKTTTLTFTDKKPGMYRFEIEMTDKLGLSVERATVAVGYYDANGKMPANRPPVAKAQVLDAVPGKPLTFNLQGSDPDGDTLGFVIKEQPQHGRLTDANGRLIENLAAIDAPLVYTPYYGFNGPDRIVFVALDGQGKPSDAIVGFKVSDKDVGVAIYEPFNYPAGPAHNMEGNGSFGFAAPWISSRDKGGCSIATSPHALTKTPSIQYPTLPAAGGRLAGNRHSHVTRPLDPKVLSKHKLLDDGGELWFSVMIEKPVMTFELQGPDLGVGFRVEQSGQKIHASFNDEIAGESNNPWSHDAQLRFDKTGPHMIVGHFTWGKTAADPDKLEIHRVYNAPIFGPMLLENPVCVLEQPIDQQKLNTLKLYADSDRAVDEVRIGTTLNSVMVGTKPLD